MEKAKTKLNALLALWHDKRGDRDMPARGDLPVQTLRPWLGNLALIDLRDGRAVFRLCGTGLRVRFDGEMTHKDISSLNEAIAGPLRRCIDQVRKSRAPGHANHTGVVAGCSTVFHEICLPLADDGATMDTLLFASYPEERK